MTPQPLPANLPDDATWLGQALDAATGLIRFVEMDRAAYRDASFLDDRMFQKPVRSITCRLDEAIAALGPDGRRDARWIFHIGHVGSTLVSRLLGELGGVLAVREPRILRDLAIMTASERQGLMPAIRHLHSRTFAAEEVALVKATSFVSEIAPELVAEDGGALFLFAGLRRYIEGILAGENSVKELRILAPERRRRLASRGIDLPAFDQSDAHLAAAAWACEMTSLEAAAVALPAANIAWADFDAMLPDMAAAMARLADHFAVDAPSGMIEAIVAGPLMKRYSKALEYDYSPSLRAELLADAARRNGADIDAAVAALFDAATSDPLLTRAIDRAGGEC